MNNNPMQMLMQMLQNNVPPQQIMGMLGNNPLMQQSMKMAQGKSPQQLMEMFQNIAQQKGIPVEQFQQFARMLGLPF